MHSEAGHDPEGQSTCQNYDKTRSVFHDASTKGWKKRRVTIPGDRFAVCVTTTPKSRSKLLN
jgi:hypothetical protein